MKYYGNAFCRIKLYNCNCNIKYHFILPYTPGSLIAGGVGVGMLGGGGGCWGGGGG